MSDYTSIKESESFKESALDIEGPAGSPPPGRRASSAPGINDNASDQPELTKKTTEYLPDASYKLQLMSIQAEDTLTELADTHLDSFGDSSLNAATNDSHEPAAEYPLNSAEDLLDNDNNGCLDRFFGDDPGKDIKPPPSPDDGDTRKDARSKWGLHDRGPNIQSSSNTGIDLCYDRAKKIPLWVHEHLTKDNLIGNAKAGKFRPDPTIPHLFSAQNKHYTNSGFSRGHVAPASNHKCDQVSMDQVHYLSNILPQNRKNNMNYWNKFEQLVRGLTETFNNVYVTSGPVFKPRQNKDTNKMEMVYVVFNGIHVPTHLFKVILIETNNVDEVAYAAFMVPNEAISVKVPLEDFEVPITEIEELTGVIFFPKLDRSSAENLRKFVVDYSFY